MIAEHLLLVNFLLTTKIQSLEKAELGEINLKVDVAFITSEKAKDIASYPCHVNIKASSKKVANLSYVYVHIGREVEWIWQCSWIIVNM